MSRVSLFLTLTPLLLRQIQLRLQIDNLKFFSASELFSLRNQCNDDKITFHASVTLVSILEFDTRLRLDFVSNKLTKNALRQKTPYSKSNPTRLRILPSSGWYAKFSWLNFQKIFENPDPDLDPVLVKNRYLDQDLNPKFQKF